MAIVTTRGRIAVATAVKEKPIFLCVGEGLAAWDTNKPAEPVGATALTTPLGWRKANQVLYCTPKADGELLVPTGNFTVSGTATNYLYLSFQFDFKDLPDKTIREVGVFLNTTQTGTETGLLTPTQIKTAGDLMVLEYLRIIRNTSVRQQFEFILQF